MFIISVTVIIFLFLSLLFRLSIMIEITFNTAALNDKPILELVVVKVILKGWIDQLFAHV